MCSIILLNHLIIIALGLYVVFYVGIFVGFNGIQRLSFPILRNNTNTLFIIVVLFGFSITNHVDNQINYTVSFIDILLLWSYVCYLVTSGEFVKYKFNAHFEYDLLIVFTCFSVIVINSSNDFISVLLAIELLSLCFYTLATFKSQSEICVDAGIKYLIIGAFSSGLIVLGITLIYSSFGNICFESVEKNNLFFNRLNVINANVIFLSALLFKLGVFPSHQWVCDVYDGVPINITLLFSTVPKIIIFSLIVKTVFWVYSKNTFFISILFGFCGLGSICLASVAALYQKRLKRLLAYSTISHVGFMILGISFLTLDGLKSGLLYVILYTFTTFTLFSLLFSSAQGNAQQKFLLNWNGCFLRNSTLAVCLALVLYSLAGLPPTVGFFAKFGVLLSTVASDNHVIAIIVVSFSSVGCFYYIKLVKNFFFGSKHFSRNWFSSQTKTIAIFVSISLQFIMLYLFHCDLLVNNVLITLLELT